MKLTNDDWRNGILFGLVNRNFHVQVSCMREMVLHFVDMVHVWSVARI